MRRTGGSIHSAARVAAGENRITDWAQARENAEVICRHVEYIEACGAWPDDFSALDAGE